MRCVFEGILARYSPSSIFTANLVLLPVHFHSPLASCMYFSNTVSTAAAGDNAGRSVGEGGAYFVDSSGNKKKQSLSNVFDSERARHASDAANLRRA